MGRFDPCKNGQKGEQNDRTTDSENGRFFCGAPKRFFTNFYRGWPVGHPKHGGGNQTLRDGGGQSRQAGRRKDRGETPRVCRHYRSTGNYQAIPGQSQLPTEAGWGHLFLLRR